MLLVVCSESAEFYKVASFTKIVVRTTITRSYGSRKSANTSASTISKSTAFKTMKETTTTTLDRTWLNGEVCCRLSLNGLRSGHKLLTAINIFCNC